MEQKQLARKAGDMPISTLNAILNGQVKDPGLSIAVRIAAALGVTLEELIGDETPTPALSPYDVDPSYRACVDALEELDDADRRRVMEFVGWLSGALTSRSMVTSVTTTPRDRSAYTERYVSPPGKTDTVAMPVQIQHRQQQIKLERGASPANGKGKRQAAQHPTHRRRK
jgi:transcriptional regulator with XRE-family HTH domain